MKKFIKIYDNWGQFLVLNTANIICVRKYDGTDEDFAGCKSIVEYGSGYLDCIYMPIDVQDFYEEFLQ
jgi:hypothetical protein